jgi:hypothetical protein
MTWTVRALRSIAILVEGPRNGQIIFQSDGRFIYEPDRGFIGTDIFTYTTSDGQSTGVVTTVEIIVDVGSVQDTSNNSNSNLLIATQDGSLVAATGTGQTQEVNRGDLFEKQEATTTESTSEVVSESEGEQEQASGGAEGGADRLASERQVLANLMDLREQLNRWNSGDTAQAVLNTKLELNGQTYKVAVNMNKVWEQFANIEQSLKQQNSGTGFQTQEIRLGCRYLYDGRFARNDFLVPPRRCNDGYPDDPSSDLEDDRPVGCDGQLLQRYGRCPR